MSRSDEVKAIRDRLDAALAAPVDKTGMSGAEMLGRSIAAPRDAMLAAIRDLIDLVAELADQIDDRTST